AARDFDMPFRLSASYCFRCFTCPRAIMSSVGATGESARRHARSEAPDRIWLSWHLLQGTLRANPRVIASCSIEVRGRRCTVYHRQGSACELCTFQDAVSRSTAHADDLRGIAIAPPKNLRRSAAEEPMISSEAIRDGQSTFRDRAPSPEGDGQPHGLIR